MGFPRLSYISMDSFLLCSRVATRVNFERSFFLFFFSFRDFLANRTVCQSRWPDRESYVCETDIELDRLMSPFLFYINIYVIISCVFTDGLELHQV